MLISYNMWSSNRFSMGAGSGCRVQGPGPGFRSTNEVVTFKEISILYSVDIEADKIFQRNKKKFMLDSENQKRPFHWEISVLESFF